MTQPPSPAPSPCDWDQLVEGDWQRTRAHCFFLLMLDETKLEDRDTSSIRTIFPKSKCSASPLDLGHSQHPAAAMAAMQLLKALLMPRGDPAFAGHSGHLSATCCASCHAHVVLQFGVTTLLSQVSFLVCSRLPGDGEPALLCPDPHRSPEAEVSVQA